MLTDKWAVSLLTVSAEEKLQEKKSGADTDSAAQSRRQDACVKRCEDWREGGLFVCVRERVCTDLHEGINGKA